MLHRLTDVFRSLQNHEVRYVVIGGIAAVLYGVPRATFDLDILIEATPENAQRLLDAFLEAGLGSAALTNVQHLLDIPLCFAMKRRFYFRSIAAFSSSSSSVKRTLTM